MQWGHVKHKNQLLDNAGFYDFLVIPYFLGAGAVGCRNSSSSFLIPSLPLFSATLTGLNCAKIFRFDVLLTSTGLRHHVFPSSLEALPSSVLSLLCRGNLRPTLDRGMTSRNSLLPQCVNTERERPI